MAKSTKGPRRPKVRAVVAVARPTVVRRVVHHVHHAAPSMLAMRRPRVAPPVIAPRPFPGLNPGTLSVRTLAPIVPPRPPFATPPVVGPPGVAPVGVPRTPMVGAPPIGPAAPRAPIPGPMTPFGRRY